MDDSVLERLRRLRKHYDFALGVCDPIDFAQRQKDLVYAIVEHLIQPLQLHEMAERSKLPKDDDEAEPS